MAAPKSFETSLATARAAAPGLLCSDAWAGTSGHLHTDHCDPPFTTLHLSAVGTRAQQKRALRAAAETCKERDYA